MARIFLSHSSRNNGAALALRDWLVSAGFDDIFLDLDPERGIVAGERWERALNEAAARCEAVLFLVSRDWLGSSWCLKEYRLAGKLNKRMFGLLIDGLSVADVPSDITRDWQLVDLSSGRDHEVFRAVTPDGSREEHVTFSKSGLARLRAGLDRAGLDPRFFAWPPADDPERAPYRGLRALEAGDAGIFFGREASLISVLDRLRGLREAAPPRFLAMLGASGAGKSSFLRAGLLPRLARDDRNFLPLPVMRPDRAAITGDNGLRAVLTAALAPIGITRAQITTAIEQGAPSLQPLLKRLVASKRVPRLPGEPGGIDPLLVLPIDQGEELFLAEGDGEAQQFQQILAELVRANAPALAVIIGIRSDSYERLQSAQALEGIEQQTFSLPPLLRGAYETIIEGPARRRSQGHKPLKIEPALTQALLADLEQGAAKDALPLLAFTLERLFVDHGSDGDLTLVEYHATGGVRGSIEAAVATALAMAAQDARLPRDPAAQLALLRRALIPWLAGIDPETATPRRRVARLSEIPDEARPLIDHLIATRLLSTDVSMEDGTATIEPAHEALLRQWGLLQGWLEEDFAALSSLDGVKRAAREWEANARDEAWLAHAAGRLDDAERFGAQASLVSYLQPGERAYLSACRLRETALRDRELAEARRYAESQKNLAQEQARVADAQRNAVRRTRLGLIAASVLALLAASAGWIAWDRAKRAEDQTQIATRQTAEARRQEDIARDQKIEAERQERRALAALAQSETDRARADESASEALAQKQIAAREAAEASLQAARSQARARLVQSNLIMKDAPRDALRQALEAGRTLVALGSTDDTLSLLNGVVGSARELPFTQPYSHYALHQVNAIVRQDFEHLRPTTASAANDTPLSVIASADITAVIDDDGRAVGRPIGSGEIEGSGARSAAWLDRDRYVLATGFRKESEGGSTVENAALRVHARDGTVLEEIITGHVSPFHAVAAFQSSDHSIVIAGDEQGGLVVRRDSEALRLMSTGVAAPIREILVDRSRTPEWVLIIFGRLEDKREAPAVSAPQMAAARLILSELLGPDTAILFHGHEAQDEIACAAQREGRVLICNRETIEIRSFDTERRSLKVDHRFAAHTRPLSAIAVSSESPLLATTAKGEGIKLWLWSGYPSLLAELGATDLAASAIGLGNAGRILLMGSSLGTRKWDLGDLASQFARKPSSLDIPYSLQLLHELSWTNFTTPTIWPALEQLSAWMESLATHNVKILNGGAQLLSEGEDQLNFIDTTTGRQATIDLKGSFREAGAPKLTQKIATGAGPDICVFRREDGKPANLALFESATASRHAGWSIERQRDQQVDLLGMSEISIHRNGGRSACWVLNDGLVTIYDPAATEPRRLDIIGLPRDKIQALQPLDDTDVFVAASGDISSRGWTLFVGRIRDRLDARDPPLSRVTATATTRSGIKRVAISSDGSRIAVASDENASSDLRVYDLALKLLAVSPIESSMVHSFAISADGNQIRAASFDYLFELQLGVDEKLATIERRDQAWRASEDRQAFYERATKDNNFTRSKPILREAVERFPKDPSLNLLLANREFYTAPTINERREALPFYDRAADLDPYDPMIYYMRGRARAAVGPALEEAIADFTMAIDLPHILPIVKAIPGFGGFNAGISRLSYQVNINSKGELYLRRALARVRLEKWRDVLADVAWLRDRNRLSVAAYEAEAAAYATLGNQRSAAKSFEDAERTLADAKSYGLEDFDGMLRLPGWRRWKRAVFQFHAMNAYTSLGLPEETERSRTAIKVLTSPETAEAGMPAWIKTELDRLATSVN